MHSMHSNPHGWSDSLLALARSSPRSAGDAAPGPILSELFTSAAKQLAAQPVGLRYLQAEQAYATAEAQTQRCRQELASIEEQLREPGADFDRLVPRQQALQARLSAFNISGARAHRDAALKEIRNHWAAAFDQARRAKLTEVLAKVGDGEAIAAQVRQLLAGLAQQVNLVDALSRTSMGQYAGQPSCYAYKDFDNFAARVVKEALVQAKPARELEAVA